MSHHVMLCDLSQCADLLPLTGPAHLDKQIKMLGGAG